MNKPSSMHEARMAMNRDPAIRQWAEQWMKKKERIGREGMTEAEFERHWMFVVPERMHEGAVEAVTAYVEHLG